MSVLADVFRTGFFAYTNNEKGHNLTRADRLERQTVSYMQDVNVARGTVDLLKGTERGAQCLTALTDTMKTTSWSTKVLNGIEKFANFTSKAVNPMLCVAGVVRAAHEDDKPSAFIKEAGAIGMMLGVENEIKSLVGLAGRTATYKNSPQLVKFSKGAMNAISKIPLINKIPNNKMTAILKAGLFVVGSCTAFATGGKIGKFIADNTTAKYYHSAKLAKEQQQYDFQTVPKYHGIDMRA